MDCDSNQIDLGSWHTHIYTTHSEQYVAAEDEIWVNTVLVVMMNWWLDLYDGCLKI